MTKRSTKRETVIIPQNIVRYITFVVLFFVISVTIDSLGKSSVIGIRSENDFSSIMQPTVTESSEIVAQNLEQTPTVTATPDVTEAITIQSVVKPTATVASTPTPTPKPTKTVAPTPTPTRTQTPTPTPTPTIDYSHPWTVAPNCPASTLNCVPCTSGSTCRYEPGKTHGFLGWACQNNNPGNIRNSSTNMSTDFKNLMIVRNGGTAACGVRYDSRGGSYFVFASYSAGYGALKAYVKGINNGEHSAYTGCGNCTLSFFFSKYSPGDSSYASSVAAAINEPVTQTLQYVVDNKLTAFVDAIKAHEGFFVQ